MCIFHALSRLHDSAQILDNVCKYHRDKIIARKGFASKLSLCNVEMNNTFGRLTNRYYFLFFFFAQKFVILFFFVIENLDSKESCFMKHRAYRIFLFLRFFFFHFDMNIFFFFRCILYRTQSHDLSCTIDALLTTRTIFYKNVKNVPTMLLRRVFQV